MHRHQTNKQTHARPHSRQRALHARTKHQSRDTHWRRYSAIFENINHISILNIDYGIENTQRNLKRRSKAERCGTTCRGDGTTPMGRRRWDADGTTLRRRWRSGWWPTVRQLATDWRRQSVRPFYSHRGWGGSGTTHWISPGDACVGRLHQCRNAIHTHTHLHTLTHLHTHM